MMETDTRVQELTTDLYYDLLEKYVALKADYDMLRIEYREERIAKLAWKQCCSNRDIQIGAHNKMMDVLAAVCYRHRGDYSKAAAEIRSYKIKQ